MENINKLVEKIRFNDKKAFEELYKMTASELYWYCMRICGNRSDAEDLLQDVYFNAWKKINQYNGTNFKAWLHSIAHNLRLNKLKGQKDILSIEDTFAEIAEDDSLSPENQSEMNIQHEEIMQIIDESLSDVQRMTVLMYYYDEKSVNEIAEEMQCSRETVKSRLYLARKKLYNEFKEKNIISVSLPAMLRCNAQQTNFSDNLNILGKKIVYKAAVSGIQIPCIIGIISACAVIVGTALLDIGMPSEHKAVDNSELVNYYDSSDISEIYTSETIENIIFTENNTEEVSDMNKNVSTMISSMTAAAILTSGTAIPTSAEITAETVSDTAVTEITSESISDTAITEIISSESEYQENTSNIETDYIFNAVVNVFNRYTGGIVSGIDVQFVELNKRINLNYTQKEYEESLVRVIDEWNTSDEPSHEIKDIGFMYGNYYAVKIDKFPEGFSYSMQDRYIKIFEVYDIFDGNTNYNIGVSPGNPFPRLEYPLDKVFDFNISIMDMKTDKPIEGVDVKLVLMEKLEISPDKFDYRYASDIDEWNTDDDKHIVKLPMHFDDEQSYYTYGLQLSNITGYHSEGMSVHDGYICFSYGSQDYIYDIYNGNSDKCLEKAIYLVPDGYEPVYTTPPPPPEPPLYTAMTSETARNSDEATVKGDSTCDNDVDIRDVSATAQYLVQLKSFSEQAILNADVVKDDVVDIKDLISLKSYLIGDKAEL